MKVLKVSLLVKIVGGHSADEALWHFFSETACKWRGKEGGGTKFDSTMPRLYISGGGKEGGGTKFDSTMHYATVKYQQSYLLFFIPNCRPNNQ